MTGLEDDESLKCPRCGAKMQWVREWMTQDMKFHWSIVSGPLKCPLCGYLGRVHTLTSYRSVLDKIAMYLRYYYLIKFKLRLLRWLQRVKGE
jgi:C4-type Zn-finger protein